MMPVTNSLDTFYHKLLFFRCLRYQKDIDNRFLRGFNDIVSFYSGESSVGLEHMNMGRIRH